MTTRADLDQLIQLCTKIEGAAGDRLAAALRGLDPADPGFDRAVSEVVQSVRLYFGDAAEQTALGWYQDIRPDGVAPMRTPRLSPGADPIPGAPQILRTRGPQPLVDNTRQWLRGRARGAVRRSMDADPALVSYARVPAGPATCAFCLLLASRGWTYKSAETAAHRKSGGRYHADCDCMVAPSWDRPPPNIDGYDPDALYAQYRAARDGADGIDESSILASMRRMDLPSCSEHVTTDGIVHG